MNDVVLDFETLSELDLTVVGRAAYMAHPSTRIQLMAYKVNKEKTLVWQPGHPTPSFITDPNTTFVAFNAPFERDCISILGAKYHNWPVVPLDRFIDVQALCGRYGLPQNLANAGQVLSTPIQKMPGGTDLIKIFCTPPYGRDASGAILPHYMEKWQLFVAYCKDDVETTYYIRKFLPADDLSPLERKIWLLNDEINQVGIPVALDEAQVIHRVTTTYMLSQNERLPLLTNNRVNKITQVKRIAEWCRERGVQIPDLKAETVAEVLQEWVIPDDVAEVLELRADMGSSSLGKYRRIMNMTHNGRMFDNSRYYGAHTGRITGQGFQLLNLPRAKVKDPENEIRKFLDYSIVEDNPVISARALVRSMIKAPPGRRIIAADYSSIEYVLLVWLAEQTEALQSFIDGRCQYSEMAAFMYQVPYEVVHEGYLAKDELCSFQRQVGKVVILGCGYTLGAPGLQRNAAKFGINLPIETCRFAVNSFRSKMSKVVKMWYRLKDAALCAIRYPGQPFSTNKVTFKVVTDRNGNEWLQMTLPSGRAMYYRRPFIEQANYGSLPAFHGLYQKTKTVIPMTLIPGRITENVIQAIARDILYHGKLKIREEGFKIIGSIYDEVIGETDDLGPEGNEAQLERFCEAMCHRDKWSADIPLRAEGFIGPRYKKM